MVLNLTELSSSPLYEQISSQLADKILLGELKPGDTLLPVRTLARKQHVNVSTVKRAYEKLYKDGFIDLQDGTVYQIAPVNTEWEKNSRVKARYEINDDSITRQRLQNELAMAREIQAELLPKPLPERLGFSIEGYIEPSSEIGGDFYNIIPLGEQRWGIVVGDACGKGLPAALLAAQTQAFVTSEMRHKQNFEVIMNNVNQHIFSSTPADKFVTMVTGIYDKKNRRFTYCVAGHEHPLILRKSGNIETLVSNGPGLGMMKEASFQVKNIILHNRDMIFMFTDGVTEVRNSKYNEYGVARLEQVLKQNPGKDARHVINKVLFDLKQFRKEFTYEDDRTILIMRVSDE